MAGAYLRQNRPATSYVDLRGYGHKYDELPIEKVTLTVDDNRVVDVKVKGAQWIASELERGAPTLASIMPKIAALQKIKPIQVVVEEDDEEDELMLLL